MIRQAKREMDGLLGQVYDCNWLALPTVKPTNKDGGGRKLLFFYRIAPNLLKGVLLGGLTGGCGTFYPMLEQELCKETYMPTVKIWNGCITSSYLGSLRSTIQHQFYAKLESIGFACIRCKFGTQKNVATVIVISLSSGVAQLWPIIERISLHISRRCREVGKLDQDVKLKGNVEFSRSGRQLDLSDESGVRYVTKSYKNFETEITQKENSMKEVVEASIAAGTLKLAGVKRRSKSERIANYGQGIKLGKIWCSSVFKDFNDHIRLGPYDYMPRGIHVYGVKSLFLHDVTGSILAYLHDEFGMERGLRQGDPLSLFLFLIVAEALQVLTLEACSRRLYNKFSLANDGSNISLL
ncbi:hypothetical protein Tco_0761336 [Tanacetum coccineum]